MVFLIDGSNLAFRAYHAMPDLIRSDGFPTGALHGWVRTLWYLADAQPDSRLLVAFDLGEDSHRKALLPTYKAQRADCPDGLVRQWPVLRELTLAMGAGLIEQQGIEADDLVASAATRLAAAGEQVAIVSADKDFGQCVGGSVTQWLPPPSAQPKLGWRKLDAAGVQERMGVRPDQVADLLALVGDTVDNIPGLTGVGPKTASAWLARYGTLDEVIAHCGELKPVRFQQMVHAEQARLRTNRELTRLRCDLPVSIDPVPPAAAHLVDLLETYEMRASAREARRRLGIAE